MSAESAGAHTPQFFDSNVLLYLMSSDPHKADSVSVLLAQGGLISVQVLNEVANVATRKFGLTWREARLFLEHVRSLCSVVPLTTDTHDTAVALAQQHRLAFYDAVIVSAAMQTGCRTLWSEDMQHGRRFGARTSSALTILNPFVASKPGGVVAK